MRRGRTLTAGRRITWPARQCGVTVLEAMVALLLLALGIMGLAALQARTLIETRSTNARSVAVLLERDLGERIVSTIAAVRDWPIDQSAELQAVADEFGSLAFGEQRTSTQACFSGAACTPSQLARAQLVEWRAAVGLALPSGDAATFLSEDPRKIGVLLAWNAHATRTNRPGAQQQNVLAVNAAQQACPDGFDCHLMWLTVR